MENLKNLTREQAANLIGTYSKMLRTTNHKISDAESKLYGGFNTEKEKTKLRNYIGYKEIKASDYRLRIHILQKEHKFTSGDMVCLKTYGCTHEQVANFTKGSLNVQKDYGMLMVANEACKENPVVGGIDFSPLYR